MEQERKLNPMMIKSYTDLEQSKKLAEFLPHESADMYYFIADSLEKQEINYAVRCGTSIVKTDIPCWSLSALLSVLPIKLQIVLAINDFQGDRKEKYFIGSVEHDKYGCYADNAIDACMAMIEKLHEHKIL